MVKTVKNIDMVSMIESLKPLLSRRDKIGYVAARNFRVLSTALDEYFKFKNSLIEKYGKEDTDASGEPTGTISIRPCTEEFKMFCNDLAPINDCQQGVDLMTLYYESVIGELSGEEILSIDWMLQDETICGG